MNQPSLCSNVCMVAASRVVRNLGRIRELPAAWRQTRQFWPVLAHYLEVGDPDYPFHITLSNGFTLRTANPSEVKVFWQVFIRQCYRIPPGCKIIVDAGANVGIFSLWAASQLPQAEILALEPFPETFAALSDHVRLNHIENRVHPVQLGLAAESGNRYMNADGDSPNRGVDLANEKNQTGGKVSVPCTSLADLLQQRNLKSVDFLKMDIEGCEWEVLLSTPEAVLRSIRHIQLEYHEVHAKFGYTPERLFEHLAVAGHRLISREEDKYNTGMACFSLG